MARADFSPLASAFSFGGISVFALDLCAFFWFCAFVVCLVDFYSCGRLLESSLAFCLLFLCRLRSSRPFVFLLGPLCFGSSDPSAHAKCIAPGFVGLRLFVVPAAFLHILLSVLFRFGSLYSLCRSLSLSVLSCFVACLSFFDWPARWRSHCVSLSCRCHSLDSPL